MTPLYLVPSPSRICILVVGCDWSILKAAAGPELLDAGALFTEAAGGLLSENLTAGVGLGEKQC